MQTEWSEGRWRELKAPDGIQFSAVDALAAVFSKVKGHSAERSVPWHDNAGIAPAIQSLFAEKQHIIVK